MVLSIDIGNSYIGMGLFKDDQITDRRTITTPKRMTGFEAKEIIAGYEMEGIGLASVVPKLTRPFIEAGNELGIKVVEVSYRSKTNLRFEYHDPSTIGADRIANAVGGLKSYRSDLIIVDLGTATTFDVVLKEGVYLGGIICPGIESSLEALVENAALIPQIELKLPERIIGRNTAECIRSGIIFTTIGQISEIVGRIRKEHKRDFRVIATGGWGGEIKELSDLIDDYDADLTLKGIHEIYHLNQ
ncbi:pantothenate kinase [candidate division WOR-3 bacterium]|uniref:Type III pantothenate kinase n=1 Tax=candidate division WOR-3 bacterium TaxID=2052148 RepID=A0A660SHR0_UNCW3|nr:MAG: pantothenate kinase [candidate division WOR-3 bacterium]